MGLIEKAAKLWKDAEEQEKAAYMLRQRIDAIQQYWEKYWRLGLVLWEITLAASSRLKIHAEKEPKWLKPSAHSIKNLNEFDYVLNRHSSNVPGSDGVVMPHVVCEIIETYLTQCGFKDMDVKCAGNSFTYGIRVSGIGMTMGKPMSTKIGVLYIHQFYHPQYDLIIDAFDIRYFDGSSHNGIRDGVQIKIYHEGHFISTITGRDAAGRPCLSRLPFKARPEYGYLALV